MHRKFVFGLLSLVASSASPAATHDGDIDTSYVADGSGYAHHAGGGLAPVYLKDQSADSTSSHALAFLRKSDGGALLVGTAYDPGWTNGIAIVGVDHYGTRNVQKQCAAPWYSCFLPGNEHVVFAALPSGDNGDVIAAGNLTNGTDILFLDSIHDGTDTSAGDALSLWYPTDFGNPAPGTGIVANAGAFDASGRFYLAGYLTVPQGDQDFFVVRIKKDPVYGDWVDIDTSFGTNGMAKVYFDVGGNHNDQANALAIAPDGKIVVVGTVTSGSFNQEVGVARLNPNGSLDTTFGPDHNGKVHLDLFPGLTSKRSFGYAVALRDDGSILVGGAAYHDTEGSLAAEQFAAIVRLDKNGSTSTGVAFGPASDTETDNAFHLVNTGNNATVVFHYFPNDPFETVSDVRSIVVQRNGRILLAGTTGRGGVSFFGISRLQPNGDPDTTFSNFGSGGKHDSTRTYSFATGQDSYTYDITEGTTNNQDSAYGLLDTPGGIYVYGSSTLLHQSELDFGYIRLHNDDAIFADNFGVLPPGG